LNFTRHQAADSFTVDATMRNHAPIEPFVVRWEYPLFTVDATLDPQRLKKLVALSLHRARPLELMDELMNASQIVKIVDGHRGIPRRVYELLREAKRRIAPATQTARPL
jgi:hypothetical protein